MRVFFLGGELIDAIDEQGDVGRGVVIGDLFSGDQLDVRAKCDDGDKISLVRLSLDVLDDLVLQRLEYLVGFHASRDIDHKKEAFGSLHLGQGRDGHQTDDREKGGKSLHRPCLLDLGREPSPPKNAKQR